MLRPEGNHKWIYVFSVSLSLFFPIWWTDFWFVVCAACVLCSMNKESPCNMKDTNWIKTVKFFPSCHFSRPVFPCVGYVLFACFQCCSVKHTAFWITGKTKLGALLSLICQKLTIREDLSLLTVWPLGIVLCRARSWTRQSFQLNRFCDSVPHLHRPSVQAVGVWRIWVKTWRESGVSLCLCDSWWQQCDVALSSHYANVPLDLSKTQKSCEIASCEELLPAVLQIPERWVTAYQGWEMLSDDVQPELCRSAVWIGPLTLCLWVQWMPMDTLWKVLYADAFNSWGKRKPKLSASSSLLPLQMPPMVASPFPGSTNPFPLRDCELEACFGLVQRAKSPLRTRQGYLNHTCMPSCVSRCSGKGAPVIIEL